MRRTSPPPRGHLSAPKTSLWREYGGCGETLSCHPGADEVCDEADNDCDGDTDEDVTVTVYFDGDHDGFGDPEYALEICTMPFGYADNDDDCDDEASAAYPGATEVCDAIDNDCDGATDEDDADDATTWFADADEDGFGDPDISTAACSAPEGFVSNNTDCNDTNDTIHPDATETCDDLDNDCDGDVDEGLIATYFMDADGDGYGDAGDSIESCDPGSLYVTNDEDCDDTTVLRAPGLAETCDDLDNDCDGAVDEGVLSTFYRDADGDGHGDDDSDEAPEPGGDPAGDDAPGEKTLLDGLAKALGSHKNESEGSGQAVPSGVPERHVFQGVAQRSAY